MNIKTIDFKKVYLMKKSHCTSLKNAKPEDRFQFERHGYFVADRKDSVASKPLFNRTVTLRNAWQK